jgi:protein-L-isoaspartate(D-aspartate) O-methyltransferase
MGMEVYSIERNYDILIEAQKLFDKISIRVKTKCADGTLGWKEHAPFDGIIVTAGSPSVPLSLRDQLAIGGRIVIPVGDKFSQKLKIVIKIDDDRFEEEDIPEFKFVPLIGKEGWNEK